MTGIYIHIPFCARKCPYCDFYSVKYRQDLAEAYVAALCRNIARLRGLEISADSVYFGGGTPALLSGGQLQKILQAVRDSVQLKAPEITLEANPANLTDRKIGELLAAGVNRLSVGVQSANDGELRFLGRGHSFDTAEKAVTAAARGGFDNISCDLMLGAKGQGSAQLYETVSRLIALPIKHISAYMLQIESGTPFDCDRVRGETADEELMSELYMQLCVELADAGYEHYEISSWAREGARSRHNMKYWTLKPYIGIGASAHSYFGGRRFFCPPDIDRFISSEIQPSIDEAEESQQSERERVEEYVMLSLRLSSGVELARLKGLGGGELARSIEKNSPELVKAGLMRETHTGFALTERGFLLSNAIISRLI